MYMRKLHLFFGLFICLLLSASLSAQVTLIANDNNAFTGDTVEIDITVANFTDIGSVQFALIWDNSVIHYRDLRNFGLANLTSNMQNNNNFGFAQLNDGKLRFSWLDPNGAATTLDDNTVIFTVVFDVVGALGQTSDLTIGACNTAPILEVEVGDENGIAIADVVTSSGVFTVGPPNATSESITKDFTLYQNQPNPFTKDTNIRFSLKNRTDTHLSIYDYTGKVIYERVATLDSGDHIENISRTVFPAAGGYFYRLKTENSDSIRKLIVQ